MKRLSMTVLTSTLLLPAVAGASSTRTSSTPNRPPWFEKALACYEKLEEYPTVNSTAVQGDPLVERVFRAFVGSKGKQSGLWLVDHRRQTFFVEADRLNQLSVRDHLFDTEENTPGAPDGGEPLPETREASSTAKRTSRPARVVRAQSASEGTGSVQADADVEIENEGTAAQPKFSYAVQFPNDTFTTFFTLNRVTVNSESAFTQVNYGPNMMVGSDLAISRKAQSVLTPELKDAILDAIEQKAKSLNPTVTLETSWNPHAVQEPRIPYSPEFSMGSPGPKREAKNVSFESRSELATPEARRLRTERRKELVKVFDDCRESLRNVAGSDQARQAIENTSRIIAVDRPGVSYDKPGFLAH